MNFLLHREIAVRELGSPLAGLGAMLPDLWRMAERRVRARQPDLAQFDPARSDPARSDSARSDRGRDAEEVVRGVDHHLEADRWFHATEVFLTGERATARALGELGVPKLGRFGHIAWELCLDGALLRAGDFDEALAGLRRDLDRLDLPAIVALAGPHGAETLDAGARSRFQDRMRRIVEGLREGSWIAGYQHGDGLARRLEGIRERVGLPRLTPAAHRAVAETLEAQLAEAGERLPALLEDRRRHREAAP